MLCCRPTIKKSTIDNTDHLFNNSVESKLFKPFLFLKLDNFKSTTMISVINIGMSSYFFQRYEENAADGKGQKKIIIAKKKIKKKAENNIFCRITFRQSHCCNTFKWKFKPIFNCFCISGGI